MATSCPTPTMATKFVQESAWTLRLRCASMDGSERAVSSTSRLREPTLAVHSVMLASRFWSFCRTGRGWDQWRCWMLWKSTGTHWRLRDTQRLSDQQPMQATKQWQARHTGITLQPTLTQYTWWHWSQPFEKSLFATCAYAPLTVLFMWPRVVNCMHLMNNV